MSSNAKWTQVTNDQGQVYYMNEETRETSWTYPEPAIASSIDTNADVAGDWAAATDNSGKTYYYNKVTNETSWEKPASLSAEPEWVEAFAPDRRKYWWNKQTNATTWENPYGSTQSPAAPPTLKASPPQSHSRASSHAKSTTSTHSPSLSLSNLSIDSPRSRSHTELSSASMASDLSPSYASQQPSRPIDDKVEKYKLKQAQFDRQITAVQQSIHDDDNDDDGSDFRFAKHRHGWFNRFFRTGDYHDIGKLLRFKKSLIRKALLKENRHLDEEAIQTFKNIMSYMGDRKSSKGPVEHAKKLLRNLMIAPGGLRDEVYMQLIKQTTDNPRPQSAVKGWELMLFCLATFPPSKGLKSFLNDYIARTTESSVPEIKAMAIKCMEFLPKIIHEGQRLHVPSKQELDKLKSREDVLIRIEMVNGDFKSFHVNPFTKVQDVTDMMSQKYNIFVTEPFALYEASSKTVNAERILDTKMRVLDVHASWENDVLLEELKIPGQEAVSKKKDAVTFDFLLFKAKLVIKTTDQKILSDPEAINLLYIQATHEVVTNRYPCKEGDITILAALQLQATFGDFQPDVHIPGWLRSNIAKYIPRHLLVDKNRVSDSLVAEWEQKVLTKYPAVAGFRTLESKLSYLDYVQEWGFYGCTFFTVGQRQFKNYPSPLTLGINSEGVLMMHPLKKSILEKYDWPDIMSWGHSDEKFIIQVGNIVQQRKLIFTTYNGKQMNNLIQEYVHYLMGEK